MATLIEKFFLNRTIPYIYEYELACVLGGSDASRQGKIKRAVARGELIKIRRGLYCLGEPWSDKKIINPYSLAQRIYGPSYISLESAMSFHNLIPEAVYTTTSVCIKRSKQFETPVGVFSYQRLPIKNFYINVERVANDDDVFLIARPWKAIGDYVYCYRKDWKGIKPLIESLRIDVELINNVTKKEIIALDNYYQHNRLSKFFNSVTKDLQL